jgi:(p)ppGpp synthase/HD superfamily hydrolase
MPDTPAHLVEDVEIVLIVCAKCGKEVEGDSVAGYWHKDASEEPNDA